MRHLACSAAGRWEWRSGAALSCHVARSPSSVDAVQYRQLSHGLRAIIDWVASVDRARRLVYSLRHIDDECRILGLHATCCCCCCCCRCSALDAKPTTQSSYRQRRKPAPLLIFAMRFWLDLTSIIFDARVDCITDSSSSLITVSCHVKYADSKGTPIQAVILWSHGVLGLSLLCRSSVVLWKDTVFRIMRPKWCNFCFFCLNPPAFSNTHSLVCFSIHLPQFFYLKSTDAISACRLHCPGFATVYTDVFRSWIFVSVFMFGFSCVFTIPSYTSWNLGLCHSLARISLLQYEYSVISDPKYGKLSTCSMASSAISVNVAWSSACSITSSSAFSSFTIKPCLALATSRHVTNSWVTKAKTWQKNTM